MSPAVAESPVSPDSARHAIDVLIVDDSVVVRRIVAKVLGEDSRFHVIGAVASGAQALEFVRTHPVDLVLLDMQMPGLDGLQVLPKLMADERKIQVVLLSGNCREGSELALHALAAGASDVVAKPSAGHFSDRFVEHLIDRLVHLVPPTERSRTPERVDQATARLRPPGNMVRAVAIGGSTGGISAMMTLLAGLEGNANFPIFITQHLPANFQALFAEQLRRATRLPVVIAEDGMAVRPGTIHVAPGRAHLSLAKDARGHVSIRLTNERCLHGSYPAVDPMFAGVARVYGAGACGVILSGMGRDGLAGAQAIAEEGGWLIAQDHETSAVWGMPGSVAKAGLASAILPPQAIADLIIGQWRAVA
ncbi:chemotaxis-specific protein-glutamate methyltransferase CheB [Sphingobium nicotianae]|uniref:Protein-glutamate methylesterase/protein-glutamine glutaminase n=1 Tax=Sphingobium nicotianae TaxID=2782607 RepID=A0A9X1ISU2_9SPHN|nr:chemotaxis-specific protein-glutamate methyltransferase CheB [Sphingobium nicotianae]MBT2188893.1 chemotaxis-specific protein-glutamate methyltransferase CheB [Sphingobium nicotianae]